jgi:hypothetical protein
MAAELACRINVLRLFSETLERVHADPQTPQCPARFSMSSSWSGGTLFTLFIDDRPEKMGQQILKSRQGLRRIADDSKTPSIRPVITQTLIRFANTSRRYHRATDRNLRYAPRHVPSGL